MFVLNSLTFIAQPPDTVTTGHIRPIHNSIYYEYTIYNIMVLVTNIRIQIIAAVVRIEVVFGRVSYLPYYILCRRHEKGRTDYILGIHISISTYNNNNNNNVHTHIKRHLRTMFRRRVQAGRHITLFYDIIIQRVSTLYLLRIIYNS